jgi:hypothetical protein
MAGTHRLVSGTTGFIVANVAGLPIPGDLMVAAVAGVSASIPDDLEKVLRPKWLSKRFPRLAKKIPLFKHRTITHYPAMQLAVLGGLVYLAVHYGIAPTVICVAFASAVAWGCFMHSCADAMTVDPRGIALLWPISRRGFHLLPYHLRVRVGSKSVSEIVFFVVWSVIVLSFLYARFRHQISA